MSESFDPALHSKKTFKVRLCPVLRSVPVAEVLALLAAQQSTLPLGAQTALASAAASLWRIGLTPVDTFKTTMQVP